MSRALSPVLIPKYSATCSLRYVVTANKDHAGDVEAAAEGLQNLNVKPHGASFSPGNGPVPASQMRCGHALNAWDGSV